MRQSVQLGNKFEGWVVKLVCILMPGDLHGHK